MHARCDTDPLDFAIDLCQQCGGEYCDDHLVYPYGPKRPPLCKTCAIAVGGVRSGAAVVRKRSRSQVKRRRAELRSMQHERRSMSFEYFEADAPFRPADPGPIEHPEAAPAPAAPLDDEWAGSQPEADVVPDPAGRTASRWRRRRSSDATMSAAPEPRPEPEAEPEPEPRRRLADLPDPTPARTSATVLLTRLRESGAVPPSIERRSRDRVDPLSAQPGTDDALPPGWAIPGHDRDALPGADALVDTEPVHDAEPLHDADALSDAGALPDDGALLWAAPIPAVPPPPVPDVPVAEQRLPVVADPSEEHPVSASEDDAQEVTEASEPVEDPTQALDALCGLGSPSAIVGEVPPDVPAVVFVEPPSEVTPPPPPPPPPLTAAHRQHAEAAGDVPLLDEGVPAPSADAPEPPPLAADEVWQEDIEVDVEVDLVPAPLRGPDPLNPPVVPEWLLRPDPPASLAPSPDQDPALPPFPRLNPVGSAHDLVLPPPPPPPGADPGDGEPWIPPALRGVDQPLTARLLEAAKTNPAALGSIFGRAIASHPAVQPEAAPPPPVRVDEGDDPWAGVPPALRGPGWRPES